jgi:hypothetical protein
MNLPKYLVDLPKYKLRKYKLTEKLSSFKPDKKSLLVAYEFVSEGPRGRIPKIVVFFETLKPDIFDFYFGDKNEDTCSIDEKLLVSDNNDTQKIFNTLIYAAYIFTNKNKNASIIIRESDKLRTRLFQMICNKHLDFINYYCFFFGLYNNTWVEFTRNTNYDAFLFERR